jgi:hypothetical protein
MISHSGRKINAEIKNRSVQLSVYVRKNQKVNGEIPFRNYNRLKLLSKIYVNPKSILQE